MKEYLKTKEELWKFQYFTMERLWKNVIFKKTIP
jgi:hypothetical protein